MKPILACVLGLILILGTTRGYAAADQGEEHKTSEATPDRAKLEQELSQRLSNSRLIGFYSIAGQEGPPQQDSYTLGKVEKAQGDKWHIAARIEYGKHVLNVPLELPIYWADQTPVITVNEFTFPGLGTYTARVMIHGDHYAGIWSSPTHGGYLWGRIQPAEPTPPNANHGK